MGYSTSVRGELEDVELEGRDTAATATPRVDREMKLSSF